MDIPEKRRRDSFDPRSAQFRRKKKLHEHDLRGLAIIFDNKAAILKVLPEHITRALALMGALVSCVKSLQQGIDMASQIWPSECKEKASQCP